MRTALLGLLVLLTWLLPVGLVQAQTEGEAAGPGPPVLQACFAALGAALVLIIICKPSRKG